MKKFDKEIYIAKLTVSFAWLSTIVGLFVAFFPIDDFSNKKKAVGAIVFCLVNVAVAAYLSRRIKKVEMPIGNKSSLSIGFGDIFGSEGVIVIPVNEYFDTLVDERVISSKTLHGKFINSVFGGNIEKLEAMLDTELKEKTFSIVEGRAKGKNKKYPLGTTVKIKENGKSYALFALTSFDENHKAYCHNAEYTMILNQLLYNLHNISQGEGINLPLIGAGQSGVNLSKQQLLEYLIYIIEVNNHLTFSGGLNIVLHNSIEKEISLNRTQYQAKWRSA